MKNIFLKCAAFSLVLLSTLNLEAQNTDELSVYRVTPTKESDLINTKLDVSFDYAKRYLYGKAWLTLSPHFYETNTIVLDAKGMDINEISMVEGTKHVPLKYTYDNWKLSITLDRIYKNTEDYTIFINYTAKPDELKVEGGKAITNAKGLYFINPDGKAGKPVQIWTQGETEASSACFLL